MKTLSKTLIQKLNYLEELEQKIRDTVEEIKIETKKEAMNQIQELLFQGKSEEAKRMIDEIEALKTLSLSINTRSIHEFVITMLNMNSNNMSGMQFHYEKPQEKEDIKEVMKRKGFQFVDYVEGKLQFEKDGEYYYAIEVENMETKEFENTLDQAKKLCNLILITDSEYSKQVTKHKVKRWMEKTEDNEVLKKYLTIQLGSLEHLRRKGTVLERINFA